jgi:hypothetical protein
MFLYHILYICIYNLYMYVSIYICVCVSENFHSLATWSGIVSWIIFNRMMKYVTEWSTPRCCRFPTVVSYSWGTLGSCTSFIQEPGPQAVGRCCAQPPIIVFHIWSVWKWGIPYTHVHPKLLPLRILDTKNHRSPGDLGPESIGPK